MSMLDMVLKLLNFYSKMDHPDPVEVKKLKARENQRKWREKLKENSKKLEEILKKDTTQHQKNQDAKRLTMTKREKRKHQGVEKLRQQKYRKIKTKWVGRTVRSRRVKKQVKLMTPTERREYEKQMKAYTV